MVKYRDYGVIDNNPKIYQNIEGKKSQVYQATHDGEGNRLPQRNRSFISFSYGGKLIEDYNFISITDGDSILRNIYGDFEDLTSNYTGITGQFYWGTNFVKNSLTLKLVSDAITEKELNDFKYHFQPGPAKELILMENPNRAIQARISETPEYELMPFEEPITVKIGGQEYTTSTTVYRGFITLTFTMDDPFWYSKENVLTGAIDKEKVKLILEDRIPHTDMFISENILTGDGKTTGEDNISIVKYTDNEGLVDVYNPDTANINNQVGLYYAGTAPGDTLLQFNFVPKIASSSIAYRTPDEYLEGYSLIAIDDYDTAHACITGDNSYGFIYFVQIQPDSDAEEGSILGFFILEPKNAIYNSMSNSNGNAYNQLAVGNVNKPFKFTTPGIYTGYNQALSVFQSFHDDYNDGVSPVELKAALRDNVKEFYSRAWAIAMVNLLIAKELLGIGELDENGQKRGVIKNSGTVDAQLILSKLMWYFLVDANGNISPATVSFDSKTGESVGTFTVRKFTNSDNVDATDITSFVDSIAETGVMLTVKENIGDMVYDKYLKLEERLSYNSNGQIGLDLCSKITTDYLNGILNLLIQYKHEYL